MFQVSWSAAVGRPIVAAGGQDVNRSVPEPVPEVKTPAGNTRLLIEE